LDNSEIYFDDDSTTNSEVSLWRAVITQALMDAKSNSKKNSFIKAKKEAISWLLGGSDDFILVCELADLDSKYVMNNAKKAIDRGCVWRKINHNSHRKPLKKTKKKHNSSKSEVVNIYKKNKSAGL